MCVCGVLCANCEIVPFGWFFRLWLDCVEIEKSNNIVIIICLVHGNPDKNQFWFEWQSQSERSLFECNMSLSSLFPYYWNRYTILISKHTTTHICARNRWQNIGCTYIDVRCHLFSFKFLSNINTNDMAFMEYSATYKTQNAIQFLWMCVCVCAWVLVHVSFPLSFA